MLQVLIALLLVVYTVSTSDSSDCSMETFPQCYYLRFLATSTNACEGNDIFDHILTTLLYIIIFLPGEVHTSIKIYFDNSIFDIYC